MSSSAECSFKNTTATCEHDTVRFPWPACPVGQTRVARGMYGRLDKGICSDGIEESKLKNTSCIAYVEEKLTQW
jgi:hypothetical protein